MSGGSQTGITDARPGPGGWAVLNLHQLGHGAEAYYLDQVVSGVEDYYAEAGEAPGVWMASSTNLLGLEGTVDGDELRSVLAGVDPSTGESLHASKNRKVPGWDLTFRAPKSVAVLWALGDERVAAQVVAAHDAAVARAVVYMEETAAWTRTGRNGVNRVPGDGFVAAGFRHRTSRDRDPLLHTHVLVANSVRAGDGRWRTIDSKGLYDHARTAGFLYQVELRHHLSDRLGVSWGPMYQGTADIADVDPALIDLFSKRRAAIEAELAEWGLSSAAAAQVATLDTRDAKTDVAESEAAQRARWRTEAAAAGHRLDVAEVLESGGSSAAPSDAEVSTAFRLMLSPLFGLTSQQSTFDRRDVLRGLAHDLPPGVTVDEIDVLADRFLDQADVVFIGERDRTGTRYTTRELLDVELDAVRAVTRPGDDSGRCDIRDVDYAVAMRPSISDEQAAAVRELCLSGRPVDVVIAAAGTGKTFSLDAARDAWQSSGHTVIGCALAAAAAKQMQEGSGIPSTTLAKLTSHLALREAELSATTVIVVDEAGMVGTRNIADLLERAERAGSKVVLVGDPKQLPEITAGGLLSHLDTRHRAITLTENRRQADPTEQEALAELRTGDVDQAFALLEEHGRVVTGDNADVVRDGMVADWWQHRQNGEDVLMLARRNVDVDDLNRRARQLMAAAGRLSGEAIVVGGRPFQRGDEIVCLRNDNRLGVLNGSTGTITDIDHDQRRVTIDTAGGSRRLDARYLDAGHVRHGYAVTVHKAQGRTTDHSLLLGNDQLSRESGYVGLSRGRESNRIYVLDTRHDDIEVERHGRPSRLKDPAVAVLDALHTSQAKELAVDQIVPSAEIDSGIDIGP